MRMHKFLQKYLPILWKDGLRAARIRYQISITVMPKKSLSFVKTRNVS